jgi:hypothetical protein
VKLTARYHDLGMVLADLENHFPYMRVQNIEIEPDSGFGGGARDGALAQPRVAKPESLAVTLRVVTLIKPITAL